MGSFNAEAEAAAVELFRTPEGRLDPYPRYHRIREAAPVHRSDTIRGWLLSRYEDCWSALRDPRLGKDYVKLLDERRPWWRERPSLARGEKSMLNVDGPYHTRLRRLVSKTFTFRSVEQMKPSIEQTVDELIEPLADAGGGDLIAELSFPLPVTVIGELLGVPAEDRPQFRQLVSDFVAVAEVGTKREQFDRADAAVNFIDAYFYDLIEERRARPTDDMLSRLVHLDDGGDKLTDEEIVTLAFLLFLAGFETTTNLVGNAMLGFMKHPGQIQLLRENPEHFEALSDEVLRYDGTVQFLNRQVKEDYPIDGETIPAGDTVILMIAAGNHDPSRFPDPDALDLRRREIRPLSFGGGIHFCLGAALARAEVEIVFRKLIERFELIEIDGDPPAHRDRLTLRGLPRLPLVLRSGGVARSKAPAVEREPVGAAVSPTSHHVELKDGALPPRPSGAADAEWRTAFRERLERDPVPKSPEELAATIGLLGSIPLFRGCSPTELNRLAETAYPIAFDPGDVLCVEGADSPECYVVAEGEAEVTMAGRMIAHVGADDVVGEKGPIEGSPRAATVTATTHMVTYAISREELERLIESSPAAATTMRAELARRYG